MLSCLESTLAEYPTFVIAREGGRPSKRRQSDLAQQVFAAGVY